jgi:NADP-dependent 3-hydroxy acid dehydrogenase YdfG
MSLPIKDAVVVITGASSGIGAATAIAFARAGARLVLAARDLAALEEIALRCQGRSVSIVPTDVTEPGEVNALAAAAIAEHGRVDVWVNNAGVYVLGQLEEIPERVHKRVLETNLLGTIHGAMAAMRIFRQQGSGRLINIGSIAGLAGYRYASVYNASKFGVRGLTEALRQETAGDRDIHVSYVAPPSIDTPLFDHAANYTGRVIKPMSPIYPPERVAAAILRVARRPRRALLIGGYGWTMRFMHAFMPGIYERMVAAQIPRSHLAEESPQPSDGNLFVTMQPKTVHGGWRGGRAKKIAVAAALLALPAAAISVAAARARS